MTRRFRIFAAGLALALTGPLQAADDEVLATVDGETITRAELEAYAQERGANVDDPKVQSRMLDEFIGRQLLYQDALRQDLDEDPEVQRELKQLRFQVLLGAAVRQAATQPPIGEERLRERYEQQYAGKTQKEYKASHILVESKEKAEEIIEELDDGAEFAALAKTHSTGPSGKQGGSLGWFSSGQMVSAFTEGVAELDKGGYSPAPVKTRFGWHVILLQDVREKEPPAFADVKEELRNAVHQQRVSDYLKKLRGDAEIEIK
ncbi:MAG TPA: peptidylprolyl isomerase [Gammaproteobacteria bacterium]|nr:peptidylprolyl isomerase [Gammaproteobacteria bacterium]